MTFFPECVSTVRKDNEKNDSESTKFGEKLRCCLLKKPKNQKNFTFNKKQKVNLLEINKKIVEIPFPPTQSFPEENTFPLMSFKVYLFKVHDQQFLFSFCMRLKWKYFHRLGSSDTKGVHSSNGIFFGIFLPSREK